MPAAVPPSRRPKRAPAPPQDRGLAHELMQQIQDNQGDPDFMTSLGRGLAVLSVFSQHPREVTMSQISTDTGISRAAVRRVLYTLEKLGYVGEQGRGYVLLPRVLGMGGAYVASSSMTAAAQPVLDALRDDVHESCSLGVLDGDDILYVARAETVRIMSIGLRAGSRLPAYCTSMGRVLLAALPRDTLEGYLERNPLRPRTERTITRMDDFLDTLEKVRREGVSLVDQELEIGLRSIAVPVRSRSGDVVGALNIERIDLGTGDSGSVLTLTAAEV
ncbi:IclR family transcriptional regulator C-terminal domain-containing protein, partial [Stenotrophomonas sp. RS-48]|uniref:IclR family transcriptional regulator domain-containing protein n=1 Tax=Stenotrophomonas sp. RS-48 TaxID=3043300 RepID=UPI0024B59D6F